MAHELDITDGQASFANSRPDAWHRLGQSVGHAMTAREALQAAHPGRLERRQNAAAAPGTLIDDTGVTTPAPLAVPDFYAGLLALAVTSLAPNSRRGTLAAAPTPTRHRLTLTVLESRPVPPRAPARSAPSALPSTRAANPLPCAIVLPPCGLPQCRVGGTQQRCPDGFGVPSVAHRFA